MTRLRTAATAALALTLSALLAPAPALAAAQQPHRAHPRAEQRALTPAEQKVDTFLSRYQDAVLDGDSELALDIRRQFMTADLNRRLDHWARQHHADPVFRTQNVPVGWTLGYGGSGAGHTTVTVTERFRDGSTVDVWYQLRLATLVVDDLENAPSPS